MLVGLEREKMMGLSLMAAISEMTSVVNAPGDADTPIRAEGRNARTASSSECCKRVRVVGSRRCVEKY